MSDDKKAGIKEQINKAVTTLGDKADALYNKLPLDKINEKLKGKVNVKSNRVKYIFFGSVLVLLLIIGSCLFGGGKEELEAGQIKRAEKVFYDNFVFNYSIEYGGILSFRIPKNSVKYIRKDTIPEIEVTEELRIAGKKGKIFIATAIPKFTTHNDKLEIPVIIVVCGNRIACFPAE